jgi:hypothetical protein
MKEGRIWRKEGEEKWYKGVRERKKGEEKGERKREISPYT